jgi:hypothetical protein
MTSTTTRAGLEEFAQITNSASEIGVALDLNPCEVLRSTFPAIADDEDVLGALTQLMGPAEQDLTMAVMFGILPEDQASAFLHNLWHTVQLAAALGHSVGVHNAIGALDVETPSDLSGIDWDGIPDVLGDDSEQD